MAYVAGGRLTFSDENGGRERLSAPIVSTGLFRLLGVSPALGRDFVAQDAAPGAAPVAILSHSLWQRRFRGNIDVIGRALGCDADCERL
jgi:putative ABC transport system permease protein